MSSEKAIKDKKTNWISSHIGQRFFNFAYSIGAAIVIWGALFKILHLPGGNVLLSIGMGTEVLMFILTAFDRPPKEYDWERVYPQLKDAEITENGLDPEEIADDTESEALNEEASSQPNNHVAGGVVVIGSGTVGSSNLAEPASASTPGGVADATVAYVDQLASITADLQRLHDSTQALNTVSETLLQSYRAITENSADINRSSTGYVEQMADLNRNIQGLNTIYEIQLKSISSQLDSIDRVNRGIKDIRDMYEKSAEQSERYCRETEKMARYMQQLNSVYEKMITAMTINMYNPMMGGAPVPPTTDVPQPSQTDDNRENV
ncbi:MAG: gliding motility protein GldL [Muribaculaceae bacterium]|nr:gliding motility protein GldL [Muribaculaceae bacterium]